MSRPLQRRPNLRDEVYRELRDAVLRGELVPGTRINGSELAIRYGVSRTPVREALQRLIQEGLAESDPTGVIHIRKPSLDDVRSFFEVRATLEAMAAGLAAERATEAQLTQIARFHEALVAARASDEYLARGVALNQDFHKAVFAASNNSMLPVAMDRLSSAMSAAWLSFFYFQTAVTYDRSVQEHGAVVKAISDHDAERASVLMREHVELAGKQILDALEAGAVLAQPEAASHA